MSDKRGNEAPTTPVEQRWSTEVVRITDAQHAVAQISDVFSPHRLEVLGPGSDLEVILRARSTDLLTVADISHGAEVIVHPGELRSYYEINIPLQGFTHSSCGTEEIESSTRRAAIFTPNRDSRMRWSPDCKQVAVKISKENLDATLERFLGYPPDEIANFSIGFDIGTEPGRSWVKVVHLLRNAIDNQAPEFVLRPLEDLVVGQLLAAQPNTFSARLRGSPPPARPRSIARVISTIEDDPGAPHTVSSLAAVAGTSVRSLQASFAEHLGLAPMEFVRRVRLSRCRQALLDAEPGDGQTVADIAFQNGFAHLPRFAAAYRHRYGETPSETLRK